MTIGIIGGGASGMAAALAAAQYPNTQVILLVLLSTHILTS